MKYLFFKTQNYLTILDCLSKSFKNKIHSIAKKKKKLKMLK